MPNCVQARAVEHFRERTKALLIRERAAPTGAMAAPLDKAGPINVLPLNRPQGESLPDTFQETPPLRDAEPLPPPQQAPGAVDKVTGPISAKVEDVLALEAQAEKAQAAAALEAQAEKAQAAAALEARRRRPRPPRPPLLPPRPSQPSRSPRLSRLPQLPRLLRLPRQLWLPRLPRQLWLSRLLRSRPLQLRPRLSR